MTKHEQLAQLENDIDDAIFKACDTDSDLTVLDIAGMLSVKLFEIQWRMIETAREDEKSERRPCSE